MTTDITDYYTRAISLIDLTSLNNDDSQENITELCSKANSSYGMVPAICVYPQFIETAKRRLAELGFNKINIATVCNFPHGNNSLTATLAEIETAINLGANEIDVVIPYSRLIDYKDYKTPYNILKSAKDICGPTVKLKAIIESGVLQTNNLITDATCLSIDAGADFIKTSTGKVKNNANLVSAECILQAIKKHGKSVGFKASGGIKLAEDAIKYLMLTERVMGKNWVSSANFRFGASSLLDDLIKQLEATSL